MIVGVFDSGVGGLSVAGAIQRALPDALVMLAEDRDNIPYGNKTPKQLFKLVLPILEALENEGCQVIVVACNSVTTTIIDKLKSKIKVPLVGTEPMVQAAVTSTNCNKIAICATPTTLASPRYQWLKQKYANDVVVFEPDCSNWALMIERNKLNKLCIKEQIDDLCDLGVDVIVLGCTHYHWIEEEINDLVAGRATVLQPEQLIIEQIKKVLTKS